MRIAINCRSFLKRNYAGIGRYAFNLVKSLSEMDRGNEYWLYAQKKYFDFKRRVPRVAAKNFHVKVDWFGRGINSLLSPIDLYHSPSPDFINITKAKIVVTVHDLVYKKYPQGHTKDARDTTDEQLKKIVAQADMMICCSKNTIKDLNEYFDVDPNAVRLVYQGVDKNIFFPLPEAAYPHAQRILRGRGIEDPFVLFVGTIEPRKNLRNLLLAFSELKRKRHFPGKLVIVGMKGWMLQGLDEAIKNLNLKESVIFLGYVTDEELCYLYNCTRVFVFPSFYEGFGFPIVEAFSCGAPVVTSNVSSCPEIAADAAITVDPYNPEQIMEGMATIIEDSAARGQYRERGLIRALDFSFEKTAQETLAVYKEVMER